MTSLQSTVCCICRVRDMMRREQLGVTSDDRMSLTLVTDGLRSLCTLLNSSITHKITAQMLKHHQAWLVYMTSWLHKQAATKQKPGHKQGSQLANTIFQGTAACTSVLSHANTPGLSKNKLIRATCATSKLLQTHSDRTGARRLS